MADDVNGGEVRRRPRRREINPLECIGAAGGVGHAGNVAIAPDRTGAANPVVTLGYDMWPPYFLDGWDMEIENCKSEDVKRCQFVVVQIDDKVRIARMLGWKYVNGSMHMELLTDPDAKETVFSKNVVMLGRVVRLTNPETKKVVRPNNRNIFSKMYDSFTACGTVPFFEGLRKTISELLSIKLERTKSTHETAGFADNWKKLQEWNREEKIAQEREKADEKLRKRRRKTQSGYRGSQLQFDEESSIGDDLKEEEAAKKALSRLTDKEVDSWWSMDVEHRRRM